MSWPMVKLSDVATINPRLPRDVDESQQVTFVPMASASEDGHLLSSESRILSETKKGFTYFDRHDVLLAKITPCFENGKCLRPGQIPTEIGFGSTEFHVIRPETERLDGLYLFYLVWSEQFRFLGEKSMSGAAGQKRVGSDFLKALEIPLPPLAEQKRIAAILDKADAIRRKRQQAIQLADDFLRAVFLDMFGDPVTNPKGLDITSIGELCDVATGATPSRGVDEYYGGDIPWVKTGEVDGYVISKTEENITHKALTNSNCKLNPVGSIVLAMYGQGKTRGKVGILGVEAATNQACAVIKPSSKILMEYLYFYLQISYEALRSLGQGAGQPNLNLSIVKGFPVPLPSELDQLRFVKVCESVGNLSKRSLSATQDSSEFFNALSQKAFRGEL